MFGKKIFLGFLSFLLIPSILIGCAGFCFAEEDADILLAEGWKYFNGDGVPQDQLKGISLMKQAAEAGSVEAMLQMGYFCAYGFASYIADDYEEGSDASLALSWLTKVAETGDNESAAVSMIDLGYSYLLGDEDALILEDPVAAFNFFEKAESLGIYAANDILGFFYTYGAVVDRDADKALALFVKGARAGFTDCLYSIEQYAYAYYAGTDSLLDINYGTSFQYYLALTDFDNPRAMYNVGLLYLYGLGVSLDQDQGIAWLKKSADSGFSVAQEMLDSLSLESESAA